MLGESARCNPVRCARLIQAETCMSDEHMTLSVLAIVCCRHCIVTVDLDLAALHTVDYFRLAKIVLGISV